MVATGRALTFFIVLTVDTAFASLAKSCPSTEQMSSTFMLFPDTDDCSIFYNCSVGEPEVKTCPLGLVFSSDAQTCVKLTSTGCQPSTVKKYTAAGVFLKPNSSELPISKVTAQYLENSSTDNATKGKITVNSFQYRPNHFTSLVDEGYLTHNKSLNLSSEFTSFVSIKEPLVILGDFKYAIKSSNLDAQKNIKESTYRISKDFDYIDTDTTAAPINYISSEALNNFSRKLSTTLFNVSLKLSNVSNSQLNYEKFHHIEQISTQSSIQYMNEARNTVLTKLFNQMYTIPANVIPKQAPNYTLVSKTQQPVNQSSENFINWPVKENFNLSERSLYNSEYLKSNTQETKDYTSTETSTNKMNMGNEFSWKPFSKETNILSTFRTNNNKSSDITHVSNKANEVITNQNISSAFYKKIFSSNSQTQPFYFSSTVVPYNSVGISEHSNYERGQNKSNLITTKSTNPNNISWSIETLPPYKIHEHDEKFKKNQLNTTQIFFDSPTDRSTIKSVNVVHDEKTKAKLNYLSKISTPLSEVNINRPSISYSNDQISLTVNTPSNNQYEKFRNYSENLYRKIFKKYDSTILSSISNQKTSYMFGKIPTNISAKRYSESPFQAIEFVQNLTTNDTVYLDTPNFLYLNAQPSKNLSNRLSTTFFILSTEKYSDLSIQLAKHNFSKTNVSLGNIFNRSSSDLLINAKEYRPNYSANVSANIGINNNLTFPVHSGTPNTTDFTESSIILSSQKRYSQISLNKPRDTSKIGLDTISKFFQSLSGMPNKSTPISEISTAYISLNMNAKSSSYAHTMPTIYITDKSPSKLWNQKTSFSPIESQITRSIQLGAGLTDKLHFQPLNPPKNSNNLIFNLQTRNTPNSSFTVAPFLRKYKAIGPGKSVNISEYLITMPYKRLVKNNTYNMLNERNIHSSVKSTTTLSIGNSSDSGNISTHKLTHVNVYNTTHLHLLNTGVVNLVTPHMLHYNFLSGATMLNQFPTSPVQIQNLNSHKHTNIKKVNSKHSSPLKQFDVGSVYLTSLKNPGKIVHFPAASSYTSSGFSTFPVTTTPSTNTHLMSSSTSKPSIRFFKLGFAGQKSHLHADYTYHCTDSSHRHATIYTPKYKFPFFKSSVHPTTVNVTDQFFYSQNSQSESPEDLLRNNAAFIHSGIGITGQFTDTTKASIKHYRKSVQSAEISPVKLEDKLSDKYSSNPVSKAPTLSLTEHGLEPLATVSVDDRRTFIADIPHLKLFNKTLPSRISPTNAISKEYSSTKSTTIQAIMRRKLFKHFHSHMPNGNNRELVFKSPTVSYVLSKAESITENLPVKSSDTLTPEDHANIANKSGVSAQSQKIVLIELKKIVSNPVKIPYFLSAGSNYKDNAQGMKPETFENNNVSQNASLESMIKPHTTSIPLKIPIIKSSLETNKVFTVQNENYDHKESKIPSLSDGNDTSFLVTENSKLRTKNEMLSSTYMKMEYNPWMKNSNTTTINYLERMVSFITRNFIRLRNLFLFENTDLKRSTSKTGNVSLSHNINLKNSGLYQSTKDSYQQGVLSEGSTITKKLRRMGEAKLEIPNESKSYVKNMKINTIKNASIQSEESEQELLSSIEENRKIFNINEKFNYGMNVGKISSATQEIKESSEDSDSSEEKPNERSSSDESNSANDESESDVSEIDESD